jgi:hypothetical protein
VVEVLLGLLLVSGAAAAAARVRAHRSSRRDASAELHVLRQLAFEDVMLFGEELAALGRLTEGHALDDAGLREYEDALEAYDRAEPLVHRLHAAEEAGAVVDLLAGGRFSAARVRARVTGEPLPERQTPCFFNPQHGPAPVDVLWTPSGHGTRRVPACRQCAARTRQGLDPEVLMLTVGYRKVPYWEAGDVVGPYTRGYRPRTPTEGRIDGQAKGTAYGGYSGT